MKKGLKVVIKILMVLVVVFTGVLVSGFYAIKFGWTDVSGGVDKNSSEYNKVVKKNIQLEEVKKELDGFHAQNSYVRKATVTSNGFPEGISIYGERANDNWCKIYKTADFNDFLASKIYKVYKYSKSEVLLNNMLLALRLRMKDSRSFESVMAECDGTSRVISQAELEKTFLNIKDETPYLWQKGEPWQVIRTAIEADQEVIDKVAKITGMQSRMIVSVAIVEQLRLYYTQRELFEKVFKPLEILANATKMAWGVMAIKEKMAIEVENHLIDENSPFYLGEDMEHLLDFPDDVDKAKERYARLTDKQTHYYSYLYGALILKQLEEQWEKAGHPIKYRPEIQATLFNIGFKNSKPKDNPQVGGSIIKIDDDKYYFGSLAYEFYYSGELEEIYPFH